MAADPSEYRYRFEEGGRRGGVTPQLARHWLLQGVRRTARGEFRIFDGVNTGGNHQCACLPTHASFRTRDRGCGTRVGHRPRMQNLLCRSHRVALKQFRMSMDVLECP